MRALKWFLETFPTPRRVRERKERLQAEREAGASAWAARHFEPRMRHAAQSVAVAFCEVEGVGVLAHGPSGRVIQDLNMADLEPIEVVLSLEQTLNIKIPDEEAQNLNTLLEWVHCVYAKLQTHSA